MCLGFLMRESEKVPCPYLDGMILILMMNCPTQQKTNGVIWYLMGCIFVLTFYPEDIATVSILMYVFPFLLSTDTDIHFTF